MEGSMLSDGEPQEGDAGAVDAPAEPSQESDFGVVDKTGGSPGSVPSESPAAETVSVAELTKNFSAVLDAATKAGVDAKVLENASETITALQTRVDALIERNTATAALVTSLETQALDVRRTGMAEKLNLDIEKLNALNKEQLDAIEAVTPAGVRAPANGSSYDAEGRGSGSTPTTATERIRSALG